MSGGQDPAMWLGYETSMSGEGTRMICSYGKPMQWKDKDGGWQVGLPVLDSHNDHVAHPDADDLVLVSHSYTRSVLEFVPWSQLSPYPSEPISEPSK